MKKYIFTESQIKKIIDNQVIESKNIEEQTFIDDEKAAINAGTKAFMDMKKIQGIDLTDRIKKYQKLIGCEQTGHMMDCKDNMPQSDKDLWQQYIYKNQSIFDKAMRWFKHFFG
jgi:hypothetical protein